MRSKVLRTLLVALFSTVLVAGAAGQELPNVPNTKDEGTSLKDLKKTKKSAPEAPKEMTPEERKERLRNFKKEVGETYQNWLNQDVTYIISNEEEAAFKLLATDERDQFIEQFWLRRDPTPDTAENEFREEHYRRIQYANEHYAAGIPGWRTDRGRIYIVWGAPDEIESHASGGSYQRDAKEGGGQTSTFPFERWRYRYLEGIGNEIIIEFVDNCQCNDYHIALDPNEKDALLHTPGGGPTSMEEMGRGNRGARMMGTPGGTDVYGNGGNKQFDALERYAKLTSPPPVKFKDLEEKVNTKIRYKLMPFDLRVDFIKVTSDTALVPITIQMKVKDMTFLQKEGIQRASVNIFGRVTTLTGRVAATFEDTVGVDEPNELLEKALQTSQLYWRALPLKSGMYKIDVAVKDVNGDRVGTYTRSIRVPEYDDEKLASSTLILADLLERVPAKTVGAGNFILGDLKVRPRVEPSDGKPASFHRDQKLNIFLQVYNLQQDQQLHKTRGSISYDIVNIQTNKSVLHVDELSAVYGNTGDQITIQKSMPLTNLEPGLYSLKITVNDDVTKQTISPSARFQVE